MTEYIVETRDYGSAQWREAGYFQADPKQYVYDQAFEWVKTRKDLFPKAELYRVIEEHDRLKISEVN